MRLDIIKCHGSGNDFVLIDARELTLDDETWATVARALSDRAGPVGSDGLLLLQNGDGAHGFAMTMRNADGSESEQCLNGLRCVARLGFERLGLVSADVRLKTSQARVALAEPLAPGVYTVTETAGPVSLDARRWVRAVGSEWIDRPIPGLPSTRGFTALGIGNPHLIAFVDMVDDAELSAIGAFAESAPALLPERANVSFAEVRSADQLFVRTFERGVGLTDSCGSAMAASTYAACATGRCTFGTVVTVLNRGGRVMARADRDGFVTIDGNATWEWVGAVEVDLASGAASGLTMTCRYAAESAAWAGIVGQG